MGNRRQSRVLYWTTNESSSAFFEELRSEGGHYCLYRLFFRFDFFNWTIDESIFLPFTFISKIEKLMNWWINLLSLMLSRLNSRIAGYIFFVLGFLCQIDETGKQKDKSSNNSETRIHETST
jgi:hypothetical protein